VTHAHRVGMDGAAVQALAVAQAVKLDPTEEFPLEGFSGRLVDFCRTREIEEKMRLVHQSVLQGIAPGDVANTVGRSAAVHESMPFAVFSFLRYCRSFEECVFCAVLNGGDRDTLGAMAGGISGAYLGLRAIPLPWREKLEGHDYIMSLACRLAEIFPG
jgi:poly(ADP-ribose) glycohydrolase ARH3